MRYITLYYNSNYQKHNVALYTIHDEQLSSSRKDNRVLEILMDLKLTPFKNKNTHLAFMCNTGQLYEDDVVIARFRI